MKQPWQHNQKYEGHWQFERLKDNHRSSANRNKVHLHMWMKAVKTSLICKFEPNHTRDSKVIIDQVAIVCYGDELKLFCSEECTMMSQKQEISDPTNAKTCFKGVLSVFLLYFLYYS